MKHATSQNTAPITKKCRPFIWLFIFPIICTPSAFAACTGQNMPFILPNITMNMHNVPLNGKIGNELITNAIDVFSCANDLMIHGRYIMDFSGTSAGIQIDNRTIYKTSEPGIGFAFALEPTNFCSNTILWSDFKTTCFIPAATINKLNAKLHLQLYKIGTIKSATNITLSTKTLQVYESLYGGGGTTPVFINTTANAFNLTAYTCSLQTGSTTNIALPKVYSNSFFANGVSAGSTPFNITVNCPSPTNLNITFTDNNNIGNYSTVLTPLASSTAKGLGIQLKYNGSIISFGPDSADPGTTNQLVLNDNLAGSQTFPFTAAYVRTGTVTAGTLAARATFTLSYQ